VGFGGVGDGLAGVGRGTGGDVEGSDLVGMLLVGVEVGMPTVGVNCVEGALTGAGAMLPLGLGFHGLGLGSRFGFGLWLGSSSSATPRIIISAAPRMIISAAPRVIVTAPRTRRAGSDALLALCADWALRGRLGGSRSTWRRSWTFSGRWGFYGVLSGCRWREGECVSFSF
jgi:hypothetical protein